ANKLEKHILVGIYRKYVRTCSAMPAKLPRQEIQGILDFLDMLVQELETGVDPQASPPTQMYQRTRQVPFAVLVDRERVIRQLESKFIRPLRAAMLAEPESV